MFVRSETLRIAEDPKRKEDIRIFQKRARPEAERESPWWSVGVGRWVFRELEEAVVSVGTAIGALDAPRKSALFRCLAF